MKSVFELLGLDETDLEWQNLALCRSGMDTNDFYENYESSGAVASVIDQVCLSCPVMAQCLEYGIDNGEYGVWGGIFLNGGKPDKNRNSHKTGTTWKEIKDKIGNSVL